MAKELKAWAYEEYQDFKQVMKDSGCVCWNGCAPCNFCMHPGNPLNLEEDEDAWQPVFDLDEMVAAARKAVAEAVEASAAAHLQAMKHSRKHLAGKHTCSLVDEGVGAGAWCAYCGYAYPF